jgi:hypothetical protein
LGYGVEKNDGPMTVFKQGVNDKREYYLDAPTSIPDVPEFSVNVDTMKTADGESVFDVFKRYGEGMKAVQLAKEKEFSQKVLYKNDFSLESKDGDNGIKRIFTYLPPERCTMLVDDINIG